ncbi:DUF3157 family protein [Aeromonas schubertii]|uniref:DUF3157 family protein n=1 Tax=Aeromonas schubertii TaxID=652 RepID=A0A0S2SE19_9GAMM|nr:DUF3157 family protein [Aeromonas schubertii]ALP39890.1 hypothetical protein WL1483_471 [Aeromonas schubertii]MBZ6067738.1 DUF3157 family protein [Aeromonas schubertii]MBZ6071054.1 DUF3157 family protein [Aeromonas schubertii]QCG47403.1 DUF3157 family protein [Aeromonas schubertii]
MKSLLSTLLLVPALTVAAPLTQVTLPDGTQIQLNDDHTWEYLVVKPAEPSVTATATSGAPVATVLTEQAKARPELLSQATKEGIAVALSGVEGDETLTLHFEAHNQGSRNAILVTGWVTLFDQDGRQLVREPARFWVAETRMPETYLRKGEQRAARDLELARPAGLTGKPLVRVELDEIAFR